MKRVTFNEQKNKINFIIAWKYAYRNARISVWEEVARDRLRFQRKILHIGDKLSVVLNEDHRHKIYKLRFVNNIS